MEPSQVALILSEPISLSNLTWRKPFLGHSRCCWSDKNRTKMIRPGFLFSKDTELFVRCNWGYLSILSVSITRHKVIRSFKLVNFLRIFIQKILYRKNLSNVWGIRTSLLLVCWWSVSSFPLPSSFCLFAKKLWYHRESIVVTW